LLHGSARLLSSRDYSHWRASREMTGIKAEDGQMHVIPAKAGMTEE
jgi:hypothetical protein